MFKMHYFSNKLSKITKHRGDFLPPAPLNL